MLTVVGMAAKVAGRLSVRHVSHGFDDVFPVLFDLFHVETSGDD